jgi:hypothetical protein
MSTPGRRDRGARVPRGPAGRPCTPRRSAAGPDRGCSRSRHRRAPAAATSSSPASRNDGRGRGQVRGRYGAGRRGARRWPDRRGRHGASCADRGHASTRQGSPARSRLCRVMIDEASPGLRATRRTRRARAILDWPSGSLLSWASAQVQDRVRTLGGNLQANGIHGMFRCSALPQYGGAPFFVLGYTLLGHLYVGAYPCRPAVRCGGPRCAWPRRVAWDAPRPACLRPGAPHHCRLLRADTALAVRALSSSADRSIRPDRAPPYIATHAGE